MNKEESKVEKNAVKLDGFCLRSQSLQSCFKGVETMINKCYASARALFFLCPSFTLSFSFEQKFAGASWWDVVKIWENTSNRRRFKRSLLKTQGGIRSLLAPPHYQAVGVCQTLRAF